MERTFFMVKPDGVQRNLAGRILTRVEAKGLKPIGLKLMIISRDLAVQHYAEHKDKPFFEELVSFITSGPVLAMVLEGENAIQTVRKMMGKTNPFDAPHGTIRGDFGMSMSKNVVHGSDSPESAAREIALFFKEEELLDYDKIDQDWLY